MRRPENWEEIARWTDPSGKGHPDRGYFEAGADAMYPNAHRKGVRETLEWCKDKHYLVDYDLDKFILQLEEDE